MPNTETEIAILELTGKIADGRKTTIDAKHYEYLSKYKWTMTVKNGYAQRTVYIGGGRKNPKYKAQFLHKLVAELEGMDTSDMIDHKNRDKLDNRAANLRPSNRSMNMHNKGIAKNNKSGYTGVCWNAWNKKWAATTSINKVYKHIGYFSSPESAYNAVCDYKKVHMGDFAL